MVLEFYYDLRSQPCRAIYYFLKATKLNFIAKVVNLAKGENKTPEYMKLNPFHKVPLLKDGDFVLTESAAIFRYISNKYHVPDHWYPKTDFEKQARVDEFLNWHHTGLRKICVELIIAKMRTRRPFFGMPKTTYDAELIKQLQAGPVRALKELDEYFLKGKPFITGSDISVADLVGYCEIMQLDGVEEDALFKGNANVSRWMKRVESKIGDIAEPGAGQLAFKELYVNA